MTIRFQAKHKSGFYVDSPLQPFTFPAGEAHIKIAEHNPDDYTHHIADLRGMSHDDLFMLAMWNDVLMDEKYAPADVVLLLPYLPGARADRGVPFGARLYADFINSLRFDKVVTLDPHSEVMPQHMVGLTVFPFERIIKTEIQDIESDTKARPYAGVIAPDHGAVARATSAAKVMGVPVYRAGKTRDFETGKLTGFHMEDELPEGRFLLVDDICDGGGTFIGLADAIGIGMNRLDLWVTHGVFSKGLTELLQRFSTIHTTNSYFPAVTGGTYTPRGQSGVHFVPPSVKVHDVTPYLYGEINA